MTADIAYEKLLALFFNGWLIAILDSEAAGAPLVSRTVKAFEEAVALGFYRNAERYRIEMLGNLLARGPAGQ